MSNIDWKFIISVFAVLSTMIGSLLLFSYTTSPTALISDPRDIVSTEKGPLMTERILLEE